MQWHAMRDMQQRYKQLPHTKMQLPYQHLTDSLLPFCLVACLVACLLLLVASFGRFFWLPSIHQNTPKTCALAGYLWLTFTLASVRIIGLHVRFFCHVCARKRPFLPHKLNVVYKARFLLHFAVMEIIWNLDKFSPYHLFLHCGATAPHTPRRETP